MTVFLRVFERRGSKIILLAAAAGLFLLGCGGARAGYAPETATAPSAPPGEYGMAYGGATEESAAAADRDAGGLDASPNSDWAPDIGPQSAVGGAYKSAPKAKTGDKQKEPSDPTPDQAVTPSTDGANAVVPRKPMLLYEAHLGMAVFRTQENLDRIEQMAVKAGGYLVNRGTNAIQVRVPAPDFESTLQKILALGDVHRREIKAEDVTAEYTDIAIRLQNAQAVRERLEQLLASAKNVEEALKVETELGRITNEIERMKGRLKLLQELAAFSTISVEFTERTQEVQTRVELPFPWLDELGLHHLLDL